VVQLANNLGGEKIDRELSEILGHLITIRELWSCLPKAKLLKLLGQLASTLIDSFLQVVSENTAVGLI
jgi:hypothetical protein